MDGINFIFKATLCVFVCLKTDFPLKIIYSINEEQYRGLSHSATSWLGVELLLPARHLLTRTYLSTPLLGSSSTTTVPVYLVSFTSLAWFVGS